MSARARNAARLADGEARLAAALAALDEPALDRPSLLDGWSRRTVVAHLARNADALVNLLDWARTGVETPMYASPSARQEGIERTAQLPATPLLQDHAAAAGRLAAAVRDLPEAAWDNEIRTAQGRTVPASQVLWMRCREVWVHAVDLDVGIGFADLPPDALRALADDVLATWNARDQAPAVRFLVPGGSAGSWGEGPRSVSGALPDVVAYLTGRAPTGHLSGDGLTEPVPGWL